MTRGPIRALGIRTQQRPWVRVPGDHALVAAVAYIAAGAALTAVSFADALYPNEVSNHRPSFFGPTSTDHLSSGVIWVILTALMWLTWVWMCRRSRTEPAPALRWMLLFSALALLPFGWRAMSNDPMEYWLWSYSQAHLHLNPLHSVLADTHWRWALLQTAWATHPDPYGPLFWALEWAMGHIPGVFFFWFWKLAVVACYLGTIPLLERELRAAGKDPVWILVIWGNPLVLLELAAAAHNDALLILPAMAAVGLWSRRHARPGVGGLLMGLSIAIKPMFAVSLPAILLWLGLHRGGRRLMWEVLGGAAGILVWFAFYGSPVLYVARNLESQAFITGYGMPMLLYHYDHGTVIRVAGGLLWAGATVWAARRSQALVAATVPLAVALLGAISWVEPWYFASIIPGLALYGSLRTRWVLWLTSAVFEFTYGITMHWHFLSFAVSVLLAATVGVGLLLGSVWPRVEHWRHRALSAAPPPAALRRE